MNYGRRLSDSEYEHAVVELYRVVPSMPSREEDLEVRKKEFLLMIDHRLGIDFPEDKRKTLWVSHQNVEKRRLRLAAGKVLGCLSFRSTSDKAHSIADYLLDEYTKVIGKRDAEAFFGLGAGAAPVLPIERGEQR